jgi:hypothetical protein
MEKTKTSLTIMPGCEGCGNHCKYNGPVADPAVTINFDKTPYGCNSKLTNLNIEEGEKS